MTNDEQLHTLETAYTLIAEQFPEFTHLPITAVKKQGHDNRMYRLGDNMLIRIPTNDTYALAVEKEQKFLPKLAPHLTVKIPIPIKLGSPSAVFPFPFSIYEWLDSKPLDQAPLDHKDMCNLAMELAQFLKELQSINTMDGPLPGQHNWWRGSHHSIYDEDTKKQIGQLSGIIDTSKSITLWEQACKTKWKKQPVWVHGDFSISNILVQASKLSAVIDFGCVGIGDPACDLVIAWTFFDGIARKIFIHEMELDHNTWLRAKAWALWKSTFELCRLEDKASHKAAAIRKVIEDIL